ncbi:uncharacterized protein [Drosophila bipectinata]|uniref:uncharacterized protein n=1 Tax=Drosophila bipectinata TaxID=42026 RepID=UPI0038B316D9
MSMKLVLFWLSLLILKISCKFEYTNVKCTSLDEKFVGFEYCYIKSVNRSYKYLFIKANLFKTPITKIKVCIVQLFKKFNGYRPFMYNITVDFCRLLSGAQINPFAVYAYNLIKTHSNINHTCPFDHDFLVEKLDANFVNHHVTKVLPVPEGDYLIESRWNINDINRAIVKAYGTIT